MVSRLLTREGVIKDLVMIATGLVESLCRPGANTRDRGCTPCAERCVASAQCCNAERQSHSESLLRIRKYGLRHLLNTTVWQAQCRPQPMLSRITGSNQTEKAGQEQVSDKAAAGVTALTRLVQIVRKDSGTKVQGITCLPECSQAGLSVLVTQKLQG